MSINTDEQELIRLVPAPFSRRHPLELVIFCGSPASGKSSFYWDVLKPLGYERVNQDTLKSVCPFLWKLSTR